MKKMLRMATMAAALFAVVTTTAKAQGGGGGGGRGGRGMNPAVIVKDSLQASEAVVAKVDSIWKAYQAEVAPLQEAARGGDAEAGQKSMAARTKATDAIKALLTDEQKTKFDALMPQRGRRGGGF